jgi:hypothetical protein
MFLCQKLRRQHPEYAWEYERLHRLRYEIHGTLR